MLTEHSYPPMDVVCWTKFADIEWNADVWLLGLDMQCDKHYFAVTMEYFQNFSFEIQLSQISVMAGQPFVQILFMLTTRKITQIHITRSLE